MCCRACWTPLPVAQRSPAITQSAEPSPTQSLIATQSPEASTEPTPTPAPTPIDPMDSMYDTVAMAKQSVVTVVAQYGRGETLHSGFIYGDGYIVTTYQGFERADAYRVYFDGENQSVNATVVQFDAVSNLMVLSTARNDLVPVTLGQSAGVHPGDYVFAVGTPLDVRYRNLVTRGIVCGLDMTLGEGERQYIITDAATNPGHTGGALFNSRGECIGMLMDARVDAGYNQSGDPVAALGMTFVVPVDDIKLLLVALSAGESLQRATLDMTVIDLSDRQLTALMLPYGVRVTSVKTGGAAQLAGIQNGDIFVAFNGVALTSSTMFNALIASEQVGSEVKLTRIQNGLYETVSVTVANKQ